MPGGDEAPPQKLEIKVQEPTLIFPASPTRKHVYFLTNLDQNIAVSMRTVYFFNAQDDKEKDDPVAVIRGALAQLLVHFYPMAGRLGISEDSKLHVECQEQGALFVEAAAESCIAELGELSSFAPFMRQLVYDVPGAKNILEVPPLIVQVTRFKCGGFVVGVHNNHCMMDGLSANEFLLAWGDLARGATLTNLPHIDRTVLAARDPLRIEFPHHEFEEIPDLSPSHNLLMTGNLVYENLKLSPNDIETLKSKIAIAKVSTFEALTALVWRARTQALEMPPEQTTRLLFAVDGRGRFRPPLPPRFFGNGIVLTCAVTSAGELSRQPLAFAVRLVQAAITTVSDSYMRSALDFFEATRAHPTLVATMLVTTWLKLPFHTVDFGWGQPICTSPASLPEREVVLFTACGKDRRGVNVLLGMPSEGAMARVRASLREL